MGDQGVTLSLRTDADPRLLRAAGLASALTAERWSPASPLPLPARLDLCGSLGTRTRALQIVTADGAGQVLVLAGPARGPLRRWVLGECRAGVATSALTRSSATSQVVGKWRGTPRPLAAFWEGSAKVVRL